MIDIGRRTIFLALAGSNAHGTARRGSDVDIRGVCVAPLSVRVSFREQFEQSESDLDATLWRSVKPRILAHPTARHGVDEKIETVIYDVTKFVRLCAAANPNALEILFADRRDWLLETPTWNRLYEARALFLSKKIQQTYLGYGMAQLKRIRTHRSWLLNPPGAKPTRKDYGLPESSTISQDDVHRIEAGVADYLRAWGVDELEMPMEARITLRERMQQFWADVLGTEQAQLTDVLWEGAARSLQLSPEMIATLGAEKRYRAALKHWNSFRAWQQQRNPKRANLEARHGYDTKHAMHLVRLMRSGLEVLRTGELQVRRADADELLAILEGAYTYDELIAEAELLRAQLQDAAKGSALPEDVDHAALDRLLFGVVTASETEPG